MFVDRCVQTVQGCTCPVPTPMLSRSEDITIYYTALMYNNRLQGCELAFVVKKRVL